MKLSDITNELEKLAPLVYAEDFDNVGLLVGDTNAEISKVLVTLDTTEEVVQEAIEKGANLIVSFHPIIFSGMKKITGKNYVERVVQLAIKNDINIYATHTALDNSELGVNYQIAKQLNLKNTKILIPQKDTLRHLVTYVPTENAEKIRNALFSAGAGSIGDYDNCSFNLEGTGTFRAGENANPFVGEIGKKHFESEIRISVIFNKHLQSQILNSLKENHPYEEVAYEIFSLENLNQTIGIGIVGELENEISEEEFFKYLKDKMNTECIRHSKLLNKKVKRIAVLGGSGSFAIADAKRAGADVFVTADLKYHNFFEAENQILLTDIGHYESEQFTKNLLTAYLSEKFPNFAVLNSEINTNPVVYN
ncbi:Nif3-like dinuclear metal center hexameric protein [Moheibacter sediminis]|uniref:GTP cyclohydrolase 1 type 2 homolog n=1 Tax=Moheibacter sediminis TaxID=1434700 RepID=A0A1W2CUK9_9FLAO|nr:Nif3-like dinuclear metal center hexameric protein [Moheibacter sediminis]SMC88582.1 dinuclear metal center protein, YbgI/SA1388 family [Moheibacter sediminis]